ncbi:MAG: phosphatidylinositol kinase [Nitrosomonadales bacterium]|nr:phosphatidylinositol kinase [Nitrosomonadales bacterium]
MTYPVITVAPDAYTQLEQLGTKAKFWYPYDENQKALFKAGRPGTGENWAEKVCCELARLLGLPHAEYELALWRGTKGVISPSLVPKNCRLILGNELLAWVHKSYEPAAKYKTTQHILRRVIAVLQQQIIGTPTGWVCPPQVSNAVGVFAGYLLLDALVCNQDRHHENWALISNPELGLTLAPTFDHASSLGRNETDETRIKRLNTKDQGYSIESYVAKARSGFFENKSSTKAMGTMEAFRECAKANIAAGQYWLDRLHALKDSDFSAILGEIPDDFISPEARGFANAMLRINRNRLLSLNGTHQT